MNYSITYYKYNVFKKTSKFQNPKVPKFHSSEFPSFSVSKFRSFKFRNFEFTKFQIAKPEISKSLEHTFSTFQLFILSDAQTYGFLIRWYFLVIARVLLHRIKGSKVRQMVEIRRFSKMPLIRRTYYQKPFQNPIRPSLETNLL